MWPELRDQFAVEKAQLDRLFSVHRELLESCRHEVPDGIELSALGAFLHSFYTGIEKMAPLVLESEVVFARFCAEILAFTARMDESSPTDTPSTR